MSVTDKDGVSTREHLEQAAKTSQSAAEELEGPPFPAPLEQVWIDFLSLHHGRGNGGMGPSRLSYEGIAAWSHLTGTKLKIWELNLIKKLDALWLEVQFSSREAANG